MSRQLEIVILVLVALGALALGAGAALYFAYPNQAQFVGGEAREAVLSLNAPPGTVTTEENPAFKAASTAPASAGAAAATGDWPSYNKTLTTERFSDLTQINTKNVGQLKLLCTSTPVRFQVLSRACSWWRGL